MLHLVDHSVWHGDVTGCIIVEGRMQVDQESERHMWNIVTINGANYLADITNSDAG